MTDKYITPQNLPVFPNKENIINESLLDRVVIELKQAPAIQEYLQKRSIELACMLSREVGVNDTEQIRNNLNAYYSGKISELEELFKISQWQLNPEYKEGEQK